MTYAIPSAPSVPHPAADTVDIAGTAWPVYKVEALAMGILMFLGALALTTSMQVAVLGSAGVTVAAWWTLKLINYRTSSRR